jgi:quercetin dioxygenase-like cupin family protein
MEFTGKDRTMSTTLTQDASPRALGALEGEARWFLGNLATVKLTGEEAGGEFSLVEMVAPQGDMPPLHVHHRDDETFLVMEGELSVFLPGKQLRGGPGSVLFAPRGIPHVFRVESETARWRVISSPPAFPEFVLEASVPAKSLKLPPEPPALTPEEVTEIAAGYGIEILGPPGTLPSA